MAAFTSPSKMTAHLIYMPLQTISATGELTLDIDDVDSLEAAGIFELVVLHEMGHTIGIGCG